MRKEGGLSGVWMHRRLNAPELMRDLYEGTKYVDGAKVVEPSEEAVT